MTTETKDNATRPSRYVPGSGLGATLYAVLQKGGQALFQDPEKLRTALRDEGCPERESFKICIMTGVTGFRELLEKDGRTQQLDLDRYVHNALRETGFNRSTVLELTASLAMALGFAAPYIASEPGGGLQEGQAYVIPTSFYEAELQSFRKSFLKARAKGELAKLDVQNLEPLVAAGHPKAKYYLGACLMAAASDGGENPIGLRLLQEAAEAGDGEAAAALGDYYAGRPDSQSQSRAYDYYTGYGAMALNPAQQKRMTGIINLKKFHWRYLLLCSGFWLLSLLTMIWTPMGIPLYADLRWGLAAIVLQTALLVCAALRWRKRPYDSLYYLPAAMLVLWMTIYAAAWLLG